MCRLFVSLVDAAESRYPFVTLEHLRRMVRSEPDWAPLASRVGECVREAVEWELLLSDRRERVRRDGSLVSVVVYRLNRRHQAMTATA